MRIVILDDNHIKLIASPAEVREYSNHDAIFFDNKDTYTCNSEPSDNAWSILRPVGGSLFNVELNISDSPFTTSEFLIVYIQTSDLNYPIVIPCYNNRTIIEQIAQKSGILQFDDKCSKTLNGAKDILNYYAFKLSCSVLDIRSAIKFWDRLNNISNIASKCNCNG